MQYCIEPVSFQQSPNCLCHISIVVLHLPGIPAGLHSEVKDVLRLSQKLASNFEVVQCTLLNKLISLGLLYFENVWQVVMMEWMLFFRNIGKEEGEAAGSLR